MTPARLKTASALANHILGSDTQNSGKRTASDWRTSGLSRCSPVQLARDALHSLHAREVVAAARWPALPKTHAAPLHPLPGIAAAHHQAAPSFTRSELPICRGNNKMLTA
jgi:hypothetical protein